MLNLGKVFFLGAGKMATALAGGLVRQGYPAEDIAAYDVLPVAAKAFTAKTGIGARTQGVLEAARAADVILTAVKPQYLAEALKPLAEGVLKDKLIISIVAGVPIAALTELTGATRIIRVMPNTPALIGKGAAAYALSPAASEEDAATAEAILGAVGYFCRLPEKLIDAVTGLSGSGPAYVFDFIQALSDGGVRSGLPRTEATRLAAMTVMGAAAMVIETGEHPAVLRDQVTSPGGTTIAGLAVLERGGFRAAAADAVVAAADRSTELGIR
ncbi:MAG: pyrroline-5-carboxylate reductase [Victivallales bacterium]|nr:pyrroline-5-carboxylate reductase [Victivallales bacterium]